MDYPVKCKCKSALCRYRKTGNDKAPYSCETRLLAYCGPAELEKLAPYFPLRERPCIWRHYPGDQLTALRLGHRLIINCDGSLKGPAWQLRGLPEDKKLRSISEHDSLNNSNLVVLTTDYQVYYRSDFHNAMRYLDTPQRIVQVRVQEARIIYLTNRMELFEFSLVNHETRELFPGRGIRLFGLYENFSSILYITSKNELYVDDKYLDQASFHAFQVVSSTTLYLNLTDGSLRKYTVALRP